jgi:hypothetical protein
VKEVHSHIVSAQQQTNLKQWLLRGKKNNSTRRVGYVACMREERGMYRVLVGKPEGKRPRHRWEDNIKMDLQDVGSGWYRLDRAGSG